MSWHLGSSSPAFDRAGRYAAELARRFHLTPGAAMVIGMLTGLGVGGLESAVQPASDASSIFERLADAPNAPVPDDRIRQHRRWAPVVDDTGYVGLIAVTDIANIPMAEWANATARDVARTDILPANPTDPVSVVANPMRAAHSESVAVTNANTVIGVVTLRDLDRCRGAARSLGERVIMIPATQPERCPGSLT